MKKLEIGAHVSFRKSEQLYGSIQDLLEIHASAGAFYISDSRAFQKSYKLDEQVISKAKELAKENNFNLENIIVHAPMVGNIANIIHESQVWELTLNSYITDLKRIKSCGIKYYNMHPGSAKDQTMGIAQCAKGINKMHQATQGDETIILIETMMPKGNYIGRNFAQIKEIIDLVVDKKRIGVCIDTCHIWDAGYDIRTKLNDVLEEFDKTIGLEFLKATHINDSKNILGSAKDRHEEIGKGYIGFEALCNFVWHPLIRDLPKVLETPTGKIDYRMWKAEIATLRLCSKIK